MSTLFVNTAAMINMIIIAVVIVLGLIMIDIAGSPNIGYCSTR